jgi:hypothetical protein
VIVARASRGRKGKATHGGNTTHHEVESELLRSLLLLDGHLSSTGLDKGRARERRERGRREMG